MNNSMNKLIEMKELLDEYLENMNMLNEDGSVKKEEEEPAKEETVEDGTPTEETECDEEELSDKDAIIMIRKGK